METTEALLEGTEAVEMTDTTQEVEAVQLLITRLQEEAVVTDQEVDLALAPRGKEVIAIKDPRELPKAIISSASSEPVTQHLKSRKKTPLPRGSQFRRGSACEAPRLTLALRPSRFTSATCPSASIRTS